MGNRAGETNILKLIGMELMGECALKYARRGAEIGAVAGTLFDLGKSMMVYGAIEPRGIATVRGACAGYVVGFGIGFLRNIYDVTKGGIRDGE